MNIDNGTAANQQAAATSQLHAATFENTDRLCYD